MSILRFFRRTKSRYADDKAVNDFARVCDKTGLLPKRSAFDAAMEDETRARAAYLDQVETLTGVRPPEL
ncbi:MAG: hypothetical protein JZU55_02600 [Afipia sp.]|nr:hypothetical protein [Afipia sp.]